MIKIKKYCSKCKNKLLLDIIEFSLNEDGVLVEVMLRCDCVTCRTNWVESYKEEKLEEVG